MTRPCKRCGKDNPTEAHRFCGAACSQKWEARDYGPDYQVTGRLCPKCGLTILLFRGVTWLCSNAACDYVRGGR